MTSETIASWSDLNDLLARRASGWIFRGQPKPYDNLCPSFARELADRKTRLTDAIEIEGRAILSFARTAHQYLRVQEVTPLRTVEMDALSFGERLDWLAIMQHYGAPTRLLDWTESLFVAAYFAVEQAWNEDGEVWACDVRSLSDAAAKTLAYRTPDKAPVEGFANRAELHADIDASPLSATSSHGRRMGPVGCISAVFHGSTDYLRLSTFTRHFSAVTVKRSIVTNP